MRLYKDLYEVVSESGRDLWEMGTQVELKTMQNKNVEGNEDLGITKELSPYDFTVKNPLDNVDKAYYFWKMGKPLESQADLHDLKDDIALEAINNLNWCDAEFYERIESYKINPGEAWKYRKEEWSELMSNDLKGLFDYTYNERLLACNQLQGIIDHLKKNPTSRRAVVNIFMGPDFVFTHDSNIDAFMNGDSMGLYRDRRVPCSVTYSWMIRDNKLNMFYHMRSSDYFNHFLNDVYLAGKMNKFMADNLNSGSNKLHVEVGSLTMYINSFHAYQGDLKRRGIF